MLIPELRKRGIFWDGYAVPGGTYRENLNQKPGQAEPLADHPASSFAWNPPEATEDANGHGNIMLNGSVERETLFELDPMKIQLG